MSVQRNGCVPYRERPAARAQNNHSGAEEAYLRQLPGALADGQPGRAGSAGRERMVTTLPPLRLRRLVIMLVAAR